MKHSIIIFIKCLIYIIYINNESNLNKSSKILIIILLYSYHFVLYCIVLYSIIV
jgi:hypothetical protein